MDIVFVILHYLAIEETKQSVKYIQNDIDTEKYHIVIVDNASNNGSGREIQEYYSRDEDITVIINVENLGFSRGNNVGFSYAKQRWNPRYIVLMNNDVYLLEKQLIHKLNIEYEKSYFAVLGPLIMTADGRCDINPIRTSPMTKQQVLNDIKTYRRRRRLYQYHLMGLRNIALRVLKGTAKKRVYKNYIQRTEHAQLHGCFMVFSSRYTERFEGLDDRTFLFREEAILYKHMLENGLNTVYLPDIAIFHKEDAATDQIVRTKRSKALFEIENHLKSLDVLLKIYEEYENQEE
ncbi:glycosyltransferase family 2 protein [Muricomes intestini]|jgi:GT2 family glycosyltransferase|uniref:glycosyltransferase family 2 protein n=1 Tax=Muricomes intestini TaxID=1796634 RepID=UPI002FDCA001